MLRTEPNHNTLDWDRQWRVGPSRNLCSPASLSLEADIQQPHGCRNMHRRIHVKPLGKDAELGTKVGLKSQRPLKELFWAQLPRFTYPRKISLRRVTIDGR